MHSNLVVVIFLFMTKYREEGRKEGRVTSIQNLKFKICLAYKTFGDEDGRESEGTVN